MTTNKKSAPAKHSRKNRKIIHKCKECGFMVEYIHIDSPEVQERLNKAFDILFQIVLIRINERKPQ